MKESEAGEIVTMIKAATNQPRLHQNTLLFWEEMLRPLNADWASKAALAGLRAWTRYPAWSEFKQAYDLQRRLSQPDVDPHVKEHAPTKVPEWVYVWRWARTRAGDWRGLPQQAGFSDPANTMTQSEYELVRGRWADAGSPKGNPLEGVIS